MLRIMTTIVFTLLLLVGAPGCDKVEKPDPEPEAAQGVENTDLHGFWKARNELYYLDISHQRPISFVLRKKAGTLAPGATVELKEDLLHLKADGGEFFLKVQEPPSLQGETLCMVVERLRLCQSDERKGLVYNADGGPAEKISH